MPDGSQSLRERSEGGPGEIPTIDATEFSLLQIIDDATDPLWRKEIHRQLLANIDQLPLESISIQTVGRRVEDMHDRGLIKSRLRSCEDVNRHLITTYVLTGQGREALEAFQSSLLTDWLAGHMRRLAGRGEDPAYDEQVVLSVFCRRYGIQKEVLRDEIGVDTVLDLLACYLSCRRLRKTAGTEAIDDIIATLQDHCSSFDDISDPCRLG
jgi:hypothetical protein